MQRVCLKGLLLGGTCFLFKNIFFLLTYQKNPEEASRNTVYICSYLVSMHHAFVEVGYMHAYHDYDRYRCLLTPTTNIAAYRYHIVTIKTETEIATKSVMRICIHNNVQKWVDLAGADPLRASQGFYYYYIIEAQKIKKRRKVTGYATSRD